MRRLHQRQPHRRARALAAWTTAALAAALLAAPAHQAGAATPGTGVLDADHKSVTWQSPTYPAGTVDDPKKCPAPADDPDGKTCDRFDLTVSVPDGYRDSFAVLRPSGRG